MQLKGKVAIVTGSSRGIGRAIALALGKEGAAVVVNGRDQDMTMKTVEQIVSAGGKALPIIADISKRNEVEGMIKKAVEEFGRLDILVNNAVYVEPKHLLFEDTEERDWDPHIDVTLRGTLYCTKAAIPHMIKQRSGRIINITSDAGRWAVPRTAIYGACKSAIAGFSRTISRELGHHGILVNCVSPATITTDSLAGVSQEVRDKWVAATPLRRMGDPDDVANLVLLLATDQGKYITGQQISVNGGALVF